MENGRQEFKAKFRTRIYVWVLDLISLIDGLPKDQSSSVIGKQLLRSGTSVLANFVEANSASSDKDFVNFFTHSLKSSNESAVWLELLRDTKKGNTDAILRLLSELEEISKILATSIITVKKRLSNTGK